MVIWRKGRCTKYKHLYDGNKAVCGSKARPTPCSKARPTPFWFWGDAWAVPKCPKCLKMEVEYEKR